MQNGIKIEWLILCKPRKRAFCEICRFDAVKHLTFSMCGDDGFVKSGINNWKKCPSLLDSQEKSQFHKDSVQKSALTSVKHQSILSLSNKRLLSRKRDEME